MILSEYRQLYLNDPNQYSDVVLTGYQLKVLLKLNYDEFLPVSKIVESMKPYTVNGHAMNSTLLHLVRLEYLERREIKVNNRVAHEYRRVV